MDMKSFCLCRCYATRNIFLRKYGLHVNFEDRASFLENYSEDLKHQGCMDLEEAVNEVEQQISERKKKRHLVQENIKAVSEKYEPLHSKIYDFSEKFLDDRFMKIIEALQVNQTSLPKDVKNHGDQIYSLPVFRPEFCDEFLAEIKHFENSPVPKTPANSMHEYGIRMEEMGLDDFVTKFRENQLRLLTEILFPNWGGACLDSHKAFVLDYQIGKDEQIAYHFDNAEVTLNVCLKDDHSEGELYFGPMRGLDSERRIPVPHRKGYGVLHRGQQLHGAWPIEDGERYNLIVWCRASNIRNQLCPMCDATPDKEKVPNGFGDGFTIDEISLCSLA